MNYWDIDGEIKLIVLKAVSQISFKGTDTMVPDSLEGKIVQDADRLDAIGAIGIARTFAYGGSKGRIMYDPKKKPMETMNSRQYFASESTTINHFYEKLLKLKDLMNTDTAKKIAEDRHSFMNEYLDRFYKEWNGE